MQSDQIYARLTNVFHDVLNDDSIELGPNLTPSNVAGWNSLTNLRLILTVEKTFGVSFSTADIGKLQSVKDLVGLIQSKL
jgi:acyl carrier protein